MSEYSYGLAYWFICLLFGFFLAMKVDSELWLGQFVIFVVFLVNVLPLILTVLSKYKLIARECSAFFAIGALVGLILF